MGAKTEAQRGSATCPGPHRGQTHSWGPVRPVGRGSRPTPAPHLSTKKSVCPRRRLFQVQAADIRSGDIVDVVPGVQTPVVPPCSVSAPATELRGAGVVQGGGTMVSAHLHSSLSTLPCQPPTPAVTPARQMCRGGAGAIPGDAALSAPGGPKSSGHLLPSLTGAGGLAPSWRLPSTYPSPGGPGSAMTLP